MALEKNIDTEFGFTLAYHKVSRVTIFENQGGSVIVESYHTQEARNLGKQPFKRATYSLPADTFSIAEMATTPIKEMAYNHLKVIAPFIGSLDV